MKKIRLLKILIVALIVVTLLIVFTQNVFAVNIDLNKFDSAKDQSNATNTAAKITGKVINWIQVFGAGFAIIMLVVLAIRWIGAAPSGKAQIAKASRYYVAGAIFIFAAIGLLQIIKNFTGLAEEQIGG